MTKAAHRRGFTLLEMMIVVAIIGILATVAAPQIIKAVRISRVTSAARSFQTRLSTTRAQAITRGFPAVMCVRGPSFPSPGQQERWFSYLKATALVPPAVPTTDTADLTTGDRLLDSGKLEDGMTLSLPIVAANESIQLVFDSTGKLYAFTGEDCQLGTPKTAIALAAGGSDFGFVTDADVSVSQVMRLRPDGMGTLP